VNYNGIRFLRECILSLLSTKYSNFEIILIDNGSTDGSVDSLRDILQNPRMRLLRLRENLGYGRACNLGAQTASGETLAFLNNDLVFLPDWLEPLILFLQNNPTVGVIQPKLVSRQDPQRLDAAGGFMDIFACAHERTVQSAGFVRPTEVFYAKGAALLVSSELFLRLGGFDDDIFLFGEDTDLCWRTWILGRRVMCVPETVVLHVGGGTTHQVSPSRLFMLTRMNRFRTILKNYERKYLLAFMPIILINHFKDILLLIALGAHYSAVLVILRVPWRSLRDLKRIVGNRRLVQRMRRVSDGKLIGRLILVASPLSVPWELWDLPLSRKRRFLSLTNRLSRISKWKE
jgi:GT2 family glycosyltransferase